MDNKFRNTYENRVILPYSELGERDKENADVWGNAKYEGRWLNIYNDPELTRRLFTQPIVAKEQIEGEDFIVADFGGAEGGVLNEVIKQFETENRKATGINLDSNQKSLDLMKNKYPNLHGVKTDLLKMQIKDSSLDAGILRFTMPYIKKEKQAELLKSIYKTLKPGGRPIIMQDGAYTLKKGVIYNRIFGEASAAQVGRSLEEVLNNRHFPSGEAVKKMAEEVGFSVVEDRELKEIQSWLSTKAYASRFEMDEEQKSNLELVFQKWGPMLSGDEEERRIRRPIIYFVLERAKGK